MTSHGTSNGSVGLRPVWEIVLLLAVLALADVRLAAAPGKDASQTKAASIIKVLPHYLDREGRHSLSPSLYERDAYQAHLRMHPELCRGMRFDIQWKAARSPGAELRLRIELITAKGDKTKPVLLEQAVRARAGWRRWSSLQLADDAFTAAGDVIAWRATLWDRDTLRAEQESFLWQAGWARQ